MSMRSRRTDRPVDSADRPRHVAVVGAGIVGLSTAWFLQEHGVEATVLDAGEAASGASWGNAGWLTPSLTAPLPGPAVLRYGVRSLLLPASPVYVPPRADPALWRFLLGFARHCTTKQWERGMRSYTLVNRLAIRAFDDLADAGAVPRPRDARPFLACYRNTAEAAAMLEELRAIERVGQAVHADYLTGPQVREAEPALGEEIGAAVQLHGQRYIHPPHFVRSLAHSVIARGGKLSEHVRVAGLDPEPGGVWLTDSQGGRHRYDAVVLATGAALGDLARPLGVRRVVQAGRGYSFTVTGEQVPRGPVYFPSQRVACTPLHEPVSGQVTATDPEERPSLLRVAGMMEFRPPGAPLDRRRVRAIADAVRVHLPGVDLDHRQDEWVGSRPCTEDGLPLIGATRSPRVFVAGGHGMWGVVLGPVTGRLLARQVVTGTVPPPLAAFDPLR